MNIERMLYLADQLENPTDPRLKHVTFNMRDFNASAYGLEQAIVCGTAACIGGHACILFGAEFMCYAQAKEVLDLSMIQGQRLFYDQEDYVSRRDSASLESITREEAITAIRRMVKEHIDETLASLEPRVEVEYALCD